MTRHYTHTSEAAALSAVSSLPSIMGEEATKALPPAKSDHKVDTEVILAIADRLNGKNWRSIQDELRALAEKIGKSETP